MDAYQQMMNDQREVTDEVIREFINVTKNQNGFTTIRECRDLVMRALLTSNCSDQQRQRMRGVYAKLKRMTLMEERGEITSVY